MFEFKVCPTCGQDVKPSEPLVMDFASGDAYHYACANPMSGVNAAMDSRPADADHPLRRKLSAS